LLKNSISYQYNCKSENNKSGVAIVWYKLLFKNTKKILILKSKS